MELGKYQNPMSRTPVCVYVCLLPLIALRGHNKHKGASQMTYLPPLILHERPIYLEPSTLTFRLITHQERGLQPLSFLSQIEPA